MGHVYTLPNRIIKPRFEWKPQHIKGHPLSIGLVGHWMFNEGAGLKTHDISGFENHGTLTNMNFSSTSGWNVGKFGQALSFDGVDDYVLLPNTASLNIAGSITLSAWITTSGGGIGDRAIIQGHNHGSPYQGYTMAAGGASGTKIQFWSGAYGSWIVANTAINDNQWHHAVVSVSGSSAAFYLDGKSDGTLTSAEPNAYSNTRSIGADRLGNNSFNGLIAETRIYNRALSAQEIRWLYVEPFADIEIPVFRKYWFVAAGGLSIPVAMHHYLNNIRSG